MFFANVGDLRKSVRDAFVETFGERYPKRCGNQDQDQDQESGAGTPAGSARGGVDEDRDICEQTAAFETLEAEYPPQGFVNVIAIQRTFHELWRSNPRILPPMDEFFATLGAWKRSAKWLKDSGEYVPHCENWLSKGGWKRLPPDNQGSRKYPILPTVAEVQARFEAEHGSGGES
jgi:hypothetical protein